MPSDSKKTKFTYASPDDSLLKKGLIKSIELATGKPKLHRIYRKLQKSNYVKEKIWTEVVERLNIDLKMEIERLSNIPESGPLVVVANHPFGVLDGILICYLVSLRRSSFKILTNSVLCTAPEVEPYFLPINFAETREALRTNLESRNRATEELEKGGCVVVFPGGTVSTSRTAFGDAEDPEWKPFTARLIIDAQADVVPIYFPGQNSRLFQIVSQFSTTLRLSLLLSEARRMIGKSVEITIGERIPFQKLADIKNRKKLVEHLRDHTYQLRQRSLEE